MREVIRIRIDEGALAYLQMLSYEVDGLRVLNCQILQGGKVENELYDKYLSDYKAAVCAFQFAFSELVKTVASEYLDRQFHHEIKFLTGELVVSEKEGVE